MYSKEQMSDIRTRFWTELNTNMKIHRSVSGRKKNWLRLKTSIKDLYFRMEADDMGARLCIDLQMRDEGVRALVYEQFTEVKKLLEGGMDMSLHWEKDHLHENGLSIGRISARVGNVSLWNQNDWPVMHVFFEKILLALDEFWEEFKDIFINLVN